MLPKSILGKSSLSSPKEVIQNEGSDTKGFIITNQCQFHNGSAKSQKLSEEKNYRMFSLNVLFQHLKLAALKYLDRDGGNLVHASNQNQCRPSEE